LSPHLTIFKPIMTMMMSIAHRITGVGLYGGMALLALFLLGAGVGGGAFSAVSWIATGFIGNVLVVMIVWAIFHHLLGGVRHALWDRGLYMDPKGRELVAQGTLVGGILLTLLIFILKTLAS
jgi:succinate dehydrogenase / fumarate reductase cytochrome b subunit